MSIFNCPDRRLTLCSRYIQKGKSHIRQNRPHNGNPCHPTQKLQELPASALKLLSPQQFFFPGFGCIFLLLRQDLFMCPGCPRTHYTDPTGFELTKIDTMLTL